MRAGMAEKYTYYGDLVYVVQLPLPCCQTWMMLVEQVGRNDDRYTPICLSIKNNRRAKGSILDW